MFRRTSSHYICCSHSAAVPSGRSAPDYAELWIAKVISTVFQLYPLPDAAPAVACGGRLASLRHAFSPSVTLAVLRRLPDPLSALAFFELSCSAFGAAHFAAAFKFLIRSLCQSGLHANALKVFDQMIHEGHAIEGPFLEFLSDSCIEAGKLDQAVSLLAIDFEPGWRCRPYILNKLLSLLVGKNRVNDAVLLIRRHLDSQGLAPDTCSFNTIIKGLCSTGDIDAAFWFFDRIRSFECSPDAVTHNTLIDGLCKAEQVDRGHDFLRRIQMEGSFMPNVVTYTTIMSGYCKIGNMEKALGVFNEMISIGIRPNRVTYNVLINGYGKMGDMPSAVSVYYRMMAYECPPDIVTFTSLIDGYCRSGLLDEAMNLWSEMMLSGLMPNVYTFAIVISSLCRKNRISEARNLLKELKGRSDIAPRAFIYNPVIDGLSKIGNLDEANTVFQEMQERTCAPDKYTYTILIIGHCVKGRMLEAVSFFHEMVYSGCIPDSITVNSLAACLLKAGMPSEINKIMLIVSGKDSRLAMTCPQGIHSSTGKSVDISVALQGCHPVEVVEHECRRIYDVK